MYTFDFVVGSIIPKSVKCIHSATKNINRELNLAGSSQGVEPQNLAAVSDTVSETGDSENRGTLFWSPYGKDPTI